MPFSLNYEVVGTYHTYAWKKIYSHIGLAKPRPHEVFKNANARWMSSLHAA